MNCKKYSVLVAIAAIAASCAKESTLIVKEEGSEISLEPMCIESSDESGTKTSLDGKIVNWTDGDCIAVYSNMDDYSKGYVFPASNISGKIATFSGDVPSGTTDFYAVYPPEKVVSANASGAVVTIPADQTPAVGTFGEELNITIGKGTKTPGKPEVGTIKFRNVCSYVKFTVPAYVSDVTKVKISADSPLAGDLTINYKGETETPSSAITSNGSNTISMTGLFGQGKTFIFVIAPGTFKNFKLEVTSDKGVWTRGVSADLPANAGRPVNLGTVDFKIAPMSATAKHTYKGTTLTGTDLTIDNLNIAGYEDYVQKVHIDIIPQGQSTAVRSADITDFSTLTSILVNSAEYPYLPQGNYTIKSTYTMSDDTTLRETTGEFSVPAPTFTVNTPSAHTNYDTYYNNGNYKNATAANAEDGSTIYGISNNGVTISSDILTKYASLAGGYSYTIDGNVASEGNNANQSWAAHNVVAKFTFDGVEIASAPLTCHVTGLPCRAPSISTFKMNWSVKQGKNTSVNDQNMVLKSGYASSATPTVNCNPFHIPSEISCNINVNYTLVSKKFGIWYTTTFKLLLNGTAFFTRDGENTNSKSYSLNTDIKLSPSANSFSATSSYTKGENVYATIELFNIVYK